MRGLATDEQNRCIVTNPGSSGFGQVPMQVRNLCGKEFTDSCHINTNQILLAAAVILNNIGSFILIAQGLVKFGIPRSFANTC